MKRERRRSGVGEGSTEQAVRQCSKPARDGDNGIRDDRDQEG